MKKYVKRIACGIIATIMMFALVSCGGNDLKDVIIGTWDVSFSSDDYTFRKDGNINSKRKYEIDGNMLYIYVYNNLEGVYEVEILSNDSLKLYEINDDGTKTNVVEYMDRIS